MLVGEMYYFEMEMKPVKKNIFQDFFWKSPAEASIL